MNIKELKNKIKKRKPMNEKKKALLKGLLFGFLAGGLATITAVGVVGCSMTQGDAKDNEPTHKAIAPRNLPVGYSIGAGTYVFNETLDTTPLIAGTYSFNFTLPDNNNLACSGIKLVAYSGGGGDNFAPRYAGTIAAWNQMEYVQANNGLSFPAYYWSGSWVSQYRTIVIPTNTDDLGADFYNWFIANTTYDTPSVSSSSEDSSGGQSSESGGASSSVSTTIEEVSTSFALQFGESNPFSAWAINPNNQEPAINYDSAAPWLLYTGTPSSSSMGSVTAEYRTYSVGEFYIEGNPAQTFDAIALTTLTLSPDNSFVVGGSSEAQLVGEDAYNKGAFIVAKAYYLNTANESRVQVMDFATTSAKLGNEQVNALTGPAWLNVGFRNIVYVGDNPNLQINGYTAPAAWWLKNNALSSSAAVATMLLGNAETGVFGLIASAFSGLGGILGIAIIPGLTIGTLMFIPLVVIIIFAIIKVLNK